MVKQCRDRRASLKGPALVRSESDPQKRLADRFLRKPAFKGVIARKEPGSMLPLISLIVAASPWLVRTLFFFRRKVRHHSVCEFQLDLPVEGIDQIILGLQVRKQDSLGDARWF